MYNLMRTIKNKIYSKNNLKIFYNNLKIFYKTLIVLAVILAIIFAPFLLFTIHHALNKDAELYTYLDDSSKIKGEPISVIIKNANISSIISVLKMNGWQEVPTFSMTNQSTWIISLKKGITPVSPRFFNGKIQTISLEGPNSTVRKRSHARIWEVNDSLYVAASYDSGIVLSQKNNIPTVTHKISPNIDSQRDIMANLIGRLLNLIMSYEDNSFPLLYKNNHDGSWYYTDGERIVLAKGNPSAGNKMLNLRRAYFRLPGLIFK